MTTITSNKTPNSFLSMSDDEIIQHCKEVCKRQGTKEGATKEIKEWSGNEPFIVFTHCKGSESMFMFLGMICSPNRKILRF